MTGETTQEEAALSVNSTAEIQQRVVEGKVTWAGPLVMLVARSVLALICQSWQGALFLQDHKVPVPLLYLVECHRRRRVVSTGPASLSGHVSLHLNTARPRQLGKHIR